MDQELLAAIREELSPLKQDIARLDQDITQIKVMIENDIQKQLNLLAEGQRILLERLPKPGRAEELDDRVDVLETVVTHHSADIAKLKKAL